MLQRRQMIGTESGNSTSANLMTIQLFGLAKRKTSASIAGVGCQKGSKNDGNGCPSAGTSMESKSMERRMNALEAAVLGTIVHGGGTPNNTPPAWARGVSEDQFAFALNESECDNCDDLSTITGDEISVAKSKTQSTEARSAKLPQPVTRSTAQQKTSSPSTDPSACPALIEKNNTRIIFNINCVLFYTGKQTALAFF